MVEQQGDEAQAISDKSTGITWPAVGTQLCVHILLGGIGILLNIRDLVSLILAFCVVRQEVYLYVQ